MKYPTKERPRAFFRERKSYRPMTGLQCFSTVFKAFYKRAVAKKKFASPFCTIWLDVHSKACLYIFRANNRRSDPPVYNIRQNLRINSEKNGSYTKNKSFEGSNAPFFLFFLVLRRMMGKNINKGIFTDFYALKSKCPRRL